MRMKVHHCHRLKYYKIRIFWYLDKICKYLIFKFHIGIPPPLLTHLQCYEPGINVISGAVSIVLECIWVLKLLKLMYLS